MTRGSFYTVYFDFFHMYSTAVLTTAPVVSAAEGTSIEQAAREHADKGRHVRKLLTM